MGIGIIGLPLSGKTTIFNAVTRGRAEVASFKAAGQQPNIGVGKVPDSRLQPLSEKAKSKKITKREQNSLKETVNYIIKNYKKIQKEMDENKLPTKKSMIRQISNIIDN